MALKEKMENPIVAALSMIVLVGAVLTAVGGISGSYDNAHTSETELIDSHPVSYEQVEQLEENMLESDTKSYCRWLKSERRGVEDSIYARRRDNADPNYIRELERDLEEMNAEYSELHCSALLNSK